MVEYHGSQWRPIEDIDLVGRQIDETVAAITSQREALQAARQGSDNLDVYLLVGLTARLTVQRDELWRIDEQLRRWLAAELTAEQRLDVNLLSERMVQLYAVIDATLQLAGELERSSSEQPRQKSLAVLKPVSARKHRSAKRSREVDQP